MPVPEQVLQTITIFNQEAKLVRNGEKPIYLLADGRFAVKHGRQWKTAKTLKGIEGFLTKKRKYVRVVRICEYDYHHKNPGNPTVHQVCGEQSRKLICLDGGKLRHQSYYLEAPETIEKLQDWARRRYAVMNKFDKEWERLTKKLVEVRPGNVDDVLAKHGVVQGEEQKPAKK